MNVADGLSEFYFCSLAARGDLPRSDMSPLLLEPHALFTICGIIGTSHKLTIR